MPLRASSRSLGLGQGRQALGAIAVSGFGTWSYNVGIAVYAYERTHSAAWVAVVTIGRYIPALLLSRVAGRMVDRFPRRTLAVTCDIACAVVMVALSALAFAAAPVWIVTVVAAISAFLSRVQDAAVLALASDVVVESRLARFSSLAGGTEAVATALGSAAASVLLLLVAAPNLFLVNAVSFAISAALVFTIRPPASIRRRPVAVAGEPPAPKASVRVFTPLQASRAVAAFIYGLDIVVLTVVASRQFSSGTSGYGWLLASAGVGGLVGAMWGRRNQSKNGTATVVTIGVLIFALPLPLFSLGSPVVSLLAEAVRGFGCVVVTAAVLGGLQRSVPSSMAGRVFGTTQTLILSGTCVGAICAPPLFDLIGFDAAIVVFAVVPCAVQLAVLPGLRRFDKQGASVLAALDPRLVTLRTLDLFEHATRAMLYSIANDIEDVSVPAGTTVIAEGSVADALFVLVEGSVDVSTDGPTGSVLLRSMTAPSFFGEIGLVRGIPRTATVTAETTCVLWRIPAAAFLAAVSEAEMSGALSDTIHHRASSTPQTSRPTVSEPNATV